MGYDPETTDPLYKHLPFGITVGGDGNCYGTFYDAPTKCVADFGKDKSAFRGTYRYFEAQGSSLEYYVFCGPTMQDVIRQYVNLTGRPALVPRWTLGYLGSTMTYTDAPDAQVQLKQFVELCRKHRIPCDGFHLSSGYTTDDQGRRQVFTWNKSKIPDPTQMVDAFRDEGLHLIPNIKPWMLISHPEYQAHAEKRHCFLPSASDEGAARPADDSKGGGEAGGDADSLPWLGSRNQRVSRLLKSLFSVGNA